MAGPLVSLLTDFGSADPWVAICKGVILSIVPDARLLDITHDIRAFSVRAGAFVHAAVLPELPVGVHLAVVDPGVGTARRPIAVRATRGDLLVGPDNGLLLPGAEALGGVVEVRELANPAFRRIGASRTFHGRDIFAPAAGHLAAGAPFDTLGPVVPTPSLVWPTPPTVSIDQAAAVVTAEVLYVDGYGNLKFGLARDALELGLGPLTPGDPLFLRWSAAEHRTHWGATFADAPVGRSVLYEDSLDRISLAINQGDAAAAVRLAEGADVRITRT